MDGADDTATMFDFTVSSDTTVAQFQYEIGRMFRLAPGSLEFWQPSACGLHELHTLDGPWDRTLGDCGIRTDCSLMVQGTEGVQIFVKVGF